MLDDLRGENIPHSTGRYTPTPDHCCKKKKNMPNGIEDMRFARIFSLKYLVKQKRLWVFMSGKMYNLDSCTT